MSKQFIGANLPLFPLRQYDSIEEVGSKKYIYTYYSKYILDDTQLPGDYLERRLHLSVNPPKDCKLYPLHKICNTLAQLLNSGVTKFINLEGKILHWKKDQYFDIHSLAVVHSKVLENNKVELFYKLPEGGLERVVTSKQYAYVYAIKFNAMCYMPMDFGDTFTNLCRKKL